MSGTSAEGIPYLTGADPLHFLDDHSLALATALARPVGLTLTALTGWSISAQNSHLFLGDSFLHFHITVARTGSTITSGSTGNHGNVDILRVEDAAHRPTRRQFVSVDRDGSSTHRAIYDPDGVVNLTHQMGANLDWPTSGTGTIYGMVCLL